MATSGTALGATSTSYYTDPQHPGKHYECKADTVVAYENDEVIFLCGGIEEHKIKHFFGDNKTEWKIVDPSKLLVKGPINAPETRTQEEIDAVAIGQLTKPFYDSREKAMVRRMGWGLAADLVTTAAFGFGGRCVEAAPVPGLGVAVAGYYFFHTRSGAMKSPRYFTWSKDPMPSVIGATHGAAAIHNILTCG